MPTLPANDRHSGHQCAVPRVDLALNLLCPSAGAKLKRRTHFAAGAPLIRHSLLHLISDSGQVQPPLLTHTIKLDDKVVRFLLGESGLDRRLAPFCQWVEPADVPDLQVWDAERQQALEGMVRQAGRAGAPLRLYFHGLPGAGRRDVAATLARAIGAPLLVADLARAHTSRTDFEQYLRLLFREARLWEAILYLDGLDVLRSSEHALSYQALLHALASGRGRETGMATASTAWRSEITGHIAWPTTWPMGSFQRSFAMPATTVPAAIRTTCRAVLSGRTCGIRWSGTGKRKGREWPCEAAGGPGTGDQTPPDPGRGVAGWDRQTLRSR